MPNTPIYIKQDGQTPSSQERHLPHIGLRKAKSILAIFVGFCIWQLLRLVIPGLETHPIFIYIYGLIEIRETSDKTVDYGKQRIVATFTAILAGIPFMVLADFIRPLLGSGWTVLLEIAVILAGALLVLCVAEWVKCKAFCGLAAAIYIILMLSHFESRVYLYSIMRAFQTMIGVGVAWLINVKLFPYPATPGSLSYLLMKKKHPKGEN